MHRCQTLLIILILISPTYHFSTFDVRANKDFFINRTSPQQDPNNNLRQMMRGQLEQVRSYCQKSRKLLDFADLAVAKTIYLITLHGMPR